MDLHRGIRHVGVVTANPLRSGPTMSQVAQLRLVCVEGNATGSEIVVEEELMIGRNAPAAGNLADDELSRHHAHIKRSEDGGYVIHDLLSTNGTFVNGARIPGARRLADGDRITVGATTLVAHLSGPQGDTEETPSRLTRLEIDFDAREVVIQLDDGPRLKLVEGPDGWRSADECTPAHD